MNDARQTWTLADIAHISPGHPFRGAIEDAPDGIARVLLMRSLDETGAIDWEETVRTTPQGRREPDWLQDGDVVFLARGNRTIAALVEAPPPEHAIISPHYFLLRPSQDAPMLPAFLAWQINQAPAQAYLNASAEGTAQRNIRRAVLEALPLVVPPLHVQAQVANFVRAARRETATLKQLIANREQQLKAVANDILNTDANRKRR